MFVFIPGRHFVTSVPLEATRISGMFENGTPTRFHGHFENCLIASKKYCFTLSGVANVSNPNVSNDLLQPIITVDGFMLKATSRMFF